MRLAGVLGGLLLAACSATRPPPFDQRDTPERAFRSFQIAVSAEDHDREFEMLSASLRARFGLPDRTAWKDARATVLNRSHLAIKGIRRACVDGDPEFLPDGRAKIPISVRVALLFRIRGVVWLRPAAVWRVFVAGDPRPRIYLPLPGGIRVEGIHLALPPDWEEFDEDLRGERVVDYEAAEHWFLDQFEIGAETADSAREDMERKQDS